MWTDVWCFTCSHELQRITGSESYRHADSDDVANGCPCIDDGEECRP